MLHTIEPIDPTLYTEAPSSTPQAVWPYNSLTFLPPKQTQGLETLNPKQKNSTTAALGLICVHAGLALPAV